MFPAALLRQRFRVTGQVQGVGFRPFVYRLAQALGIVGFICNDAAGVTIEAQGDSQQLLRFTKALRQERPPLAAIASIDSCPLPPHADAAAFVIAPSPPGTDISADVAADTAICPDCLAELRNGNDRRHGYALINCTNCGPRYTIIDDVPYDRAHTTMSGFVLCPQCQREYDDPGNRRFHAQPTACPRCGPTLRLLNAEGEALAGDPIAQAAVLLAAGKIVAIKGLGGFHLAVRGDDDAAVARLRQRKGRDHKPLALMCADLAHAQQLVRLSHQAQAALTGPAAPIVIAPRRRGAAVAAQVAPGHHRLGVLLPYTPLQHLLFDALRDLPAVGSALAGDAVPALVMTSGNRSDEPLVIGNDEAIERLGRAGLCDALLLHDRPIARCVDDSVLLDLGRDSALLPLRRARGFVPAALPLPVAWAQPGLCVGGELKATVALVRNGRAVISQHLGDLTHPLAYRYFQQAIDDLTRLLGCQPRWIAHDLHPAYLSTRYAREFARQRSIGLIPVQHHHAHAAAVLAEHGQTGPVLALVCDGAGYGLDGSIWGGELLLVDACSAQKLGGLRPLHLPGGDAAARDTRRCALALLQQALGPSFAEHPAAQALFGHRLERQILAQMIGGNVNCAVSSAAGRVFDGVAALLGVCLHNHYEAQAAQQLESLASSVPTIVPPTPLFALHEREGQIQLDLAPLIRALLQGVDEGLPVAELSALFHDALALALAAAAERAAQRTAMDTVVLSGGVMCNQRLTRRLTVLLRERGLTVLRHEQVPANDGGIALGQALVASALLAAGALPAEGS